MNIPKYKKKSLVNKLDNITKNVSKRPVYVVKKQKDGNYALIHYFNNKILIDEIPFARSAKSLASVIHRAKKVDEHTLAKFRSKMDNFYKHYNDALFYKHTMSTTKDQTKFFSTEARLDLTIMYLKEAKQSLINF
jgi:hypothetical protein